MERKWHDVIDGLELGKYWLWLCNNGALWLMQFRDLLLGSLEHEVKLCSRFCGPEDNFREAIKPETTGRLFVCASQFPQLATESHKKLKCNIKWQLWCPSLKCQYFDGRTKSFVLSFLLSEAWTTIDRQPALPAFSNFFLWLGNQKRWALSTARAWSDLHDGKSSRKASKFPDMSPIRRFFNFFLFHLRAAFKYRNLRQFLSFLLDRVATELTHSVELTFLRFSALFFDILKVMLFIALVLCRKRFWVSFVGWMVGLVKIHYFYNWMKNLNLRRFLFWSKLILQKLISLEVTIHKVLINWITSPWKRKCV